MIDQIIDSSIALSTNCPRINKEMFILSCSVANYVRKQRTDKGEEAVTVNTRLLQSASG